MEKTKKFLLFLALFSLFLGGCTTYHFKIYQGKLPTEEVKIDQRSDEVKPSEPASLIAGEKSNVIYIYIFSDGTTTVTTEASVPLHMLREGKGQK